MALHVATALALLVYFWRDWVRIDPRALPLDRAAPDRDRRRTDGVAADRRDDPGRAHRPAARTRAADALREAARRRDLPDHQRLILFAGEWLRRRSARPTATGRAAPGRRPRRRRGRAGRSSRGSGGQRRR